MLRELFHIGPVTIYGYGLMVAIGVINCVLVAMKRAKGYGVDPDILFNAAFTGIICGIIGAKLMYWITILPDIIKNPKLMLDFSGGFVVYGGLVAGLLAAVVYLKVKKQTVFDKLDIAVASIALGQGFGRIGCFLAGCCYGKIAPEGAWYAVRFPAGAEAPAGIGLYPTQLMSSLFDFLLFFLLWYLTDRVRFRGAIVALYMMIYSVARFLIEYIRTEPITVGRFTTAQFTAFFIFAGGLILWFVMKKLALPPLRKIAPGAAPAEDGEAGEEAGKESEEEIPEEKEEPAEETAEEPEEETVEETAEEITDSAEVVSEETAEETTEEAAEETTEETADETVAEAVEETIDETAEAVSEEVPEDVTSPEETEEGGEKAED